jgi:hypothetical protein
LRNQYFGSAFLFILPQKNHNLNVNIKIKMKNNLAGNWRKQKINPGSIFFASLRGKGAPARALGVLFFIITFALPTFAFSQDIVNLKIIAKIESNFNPLAYNPKTQAIGLYQITPIVLQEYNQFNKTNYTKKDVFNPIINEKIARWYLFMRIPQMLKYYKKEVNLRNILVAYNAGIKAVVKGYIPKETREYLRKYENFKNNFS